MPEPPFCPALFGYAPPPPPPPLLVVPAVPVPGALPVPPPPAPPDDVDDGLVQPVFPPAPPPPANHPLPDGPGVPTGDAVGGPAIAT